jgi:hypothetical protein
MKAKVQSWQGLEKHLSSAQNLQLSFFSSLANKCIKIQKMLLEF